MFLIGIAIVSFSDKPQNFLPCLILHQQLLGPFGVWISLIFMNQRFCDILFYSPKNVKSPYLHQLIYQILASVLKKIQSLSQKKMENIPVEILELVFLLLSSLKDIQKCFSTCSKWRKIILNIFKNKNSKCIFRYL